MFKKIPHTFTIVFFLIVLSAMLTWVIPGGEFVRETISVNGTAREIVKNNSFHYVDSHPQTWQVLSALFDGFVDKADIIIFILMVGGAFWILNNTKAIDVGVMSFLRFIARFQNYRLLKWIGVNNLILSMIIIMFSIFGAVFGMSEETIAFIVIFVPLSISMGYDSIVGVCICYMAAHVGFAGALMNPFTIGIAQGIAQIPIFSGIEYRLFCWIILTSIEIVIVLWYANRIKKNPEKSPMYSLDAYWRERIDNQNIQKTAYYTPKSAWCVWVFLLAIMTYCSLVFSVSSFTIGQTSIDIPIIPILTVLFAIIGFVSLRKSVHFFVLNLLFFTIFFLVVGVLAYGWYVMEISTLFLAMGIFAGLSNNNGADSIAKQFLEGAKDIMNASLIVGLASGIVIILKNGMVIDTILYGLTKSLAELGETASVGVMYVFQTGLNIIMPSGSAKAALTMPIMSQFADLINVSRQTTVLAFQFGDGFTNMITPTSGVLIGCLAIAKIPYTVWVKWVWKIILFFILFGFVLLLPTLFIQLPGF